jgi:hypothetical protein
LQHVWTDEKSQVLIDENENDCMHSKLQKMENSFIFTSTRPFNSSNQNPRDYVIEVSKIQIIVFNPQINDLIRKE